MALYKVTWSDWDDYHACTHHWASSPSAALAKSRRQLFALRTPCCGTASVEFVCEGDKPKKAVRKSVKKFLVDPRQMDLFDL